MLEDLNGRFVWTKDRRDKWTLLNAPDGQLLGDCEDYAMTALWLICNRSWLRFWWMVITVQAVFWHVRHVGYGPGRGNHVVLWVRGRGWIDCSFTAWSATTSHSRRFLYLAPMLALVIAIKR